MIAEAVGGGVAIVDEDHAFETASGGRQRGGEIGLGGGELIAAGDFDFAAGDGAAEALAGLLADFGGVGEDEAFFERLG